MSLRLRGGLNAGCTEGESLGQISVCSINGGHFYLLLSFPPSSHCSGILAVFSLLGFLVPHKSAFALLS